MGDRHCQLQRDVNKNQYSRFKQRLQDAIPARGVLYCLSFSGFLVNFMMRNDINITMVAMVRIPPQSLTSNTPIDNQTTVGNNSFNNNLSSSAYCIVDQHYSDNSVNPNKNNEEGEFDWDSTTQATIIGAFYWCYILSQIIGGVLTQRYGTKAVFACGQLLTALCSLLIPCGASIHFSCLIALRSIQGIASGFTWPAMYAIVGHWIPKSERSRFMSSFQGFSIGIGLTYPLCGFLIANFGWRAVFYVTGSIGILWCGIWWLLAFDSPASHPRITQTERLYIESNVEITEDKGMAVPWKNIITSTSVWAIAITTFGRIWIHSTFLIPGPMYMKTVLGFSIQKNGVLSGAPFLCSYISTVLFCYAADILGKRNILSLTNIRKLFSALSQVLPGVLIILIGYVGCDINLVVVTWFIAVTCITAAYAGAMVNIVDIAPNFAGPILAFAQTIHMTASFISPLVAGAITQDNYGLEQWRKIFGVSSAVSILTYVAFLIFGTAEIQKWNYSEGNIPDKGAASKKLLSVTPCKDNDEDVVALSEEQP